jgi:hypothetical protein
MRNQPVLASVLCGDVTLAGGVIIGSRTVQAPAGWVLLAAECVATRVGEL